MCNQIKSQLVAGETARLEGKRVSLLRRGWRGMLPGPFGRRKVVVDLAVGKDPQHQLRYIEVCLHGEEGAVRIPHCYIFAKECPARFDSKQQNAWLVARFVLRREIALYEQQVAEAEAEQRQELMKEIETLAKSGSSWPAKGDMVEFPSESTAISTPLPSRPQLRLVQSNTSPKESAESASKADDEPSKPKPADKTESPYPRLMLCHLTLRDQTIGFLKLETPYGWVVFNRYMALGQDSFQLQLEDVPVGHSLYSLFAQEQKEGRKISVWLDRYGFMPCYADSMSSFLVTYLSHDAWHESKRLASA